MSVTSGTKSESGLGETIRVVIHALLIALVIRTFLFQPFNIPSGSMKATLLVGDYLFVSKYCYGYSHYSIPLSPPLFSGRIFGSEPARGDIVVFRLPKDDSTDYIKRVIGLPGDRIQMKEGLLYINDTPVKRERLSDYIGEDPCGSDATARVKRWKETLPNGVTYESLDCVDNGFYDNTNVYTVPPGHFFMMGDNRDNSTDSRVLSAVGYHNRAMNDETPDIQTSPSSGEGSPQPDAAASPRQRRRSAARSAPRPPPPRSRRGSGTNLPIRPCLRPPSRTFPP